ncbi:hypothetical protein Pdw03_5229 [Penicillium digitatum]|uniref:Uncharacterized protein n=1 Tax=Penicillium digitatum TaxID=36651 RepID=A0A7T6XUE2_PENDI|nr:hypothetical protein Pdw03_5229 [Penicillium digitatum]
MQYRTRSSMSCTGVGKTSLHGSLPPFRTYRSINSGFIAADRENQWTVQIWIFPTSALKSIHSCTTPHPSPPAVSSGDVPGGLAGSITRKSPHVIERRRYSKQCGGNVAEQHSDEESLV